MDIKKLDSIDEHINTLSVYFRSFYEKEPWGDYQCCDQCFGEHSLSDAPRFSQDEKICPECKNSLNPFWSEARCKSVLKNAIFTTGLFENGELKGWIITKKISDSIIGIDFMGLDTKFRRKKPKVILMKEAAQILSLFYIRKYIKPLHEWASNKMRQLPVVSLQIYFSFEEEAKRLGFTTVQSTTLKNAKNIHYALRTVGFRLTKKNLPHNRVLFEKKI